MKSFKQKCEDFKESEFLLPPQIKRKLREKCLGQEDPLEKERQPIPIVLPGEFHGQRSLLGYSPWGCKELDMTERLTLSFTAFILFFFFSGHICQDRGDRRGDKTIWKPKQVPSVRRSKKKSSFHRDLINKQQTEYLCCGVCSVVKFCSILCNLMGCSTSGSSVLHYLPEFDQIHVH